jgi:hypothetical protein
MFRRLSRLVLRIWIALLLVAQIAVAAHACDGLASAPLSQDNSAFAPTAVAMVDCADSDDELSLTMSNLCAEHCRTGQQGDQSATVQSPSTSYKLLYGVPTPAPAAAPPSVGTSVLSALALAQRPHAIEHCVRRT